MVEGVAYADFEILRNNDALGHRPGNKSNDNKMVTVFLDAFCLQRRPLINLILQLNHADRG